ncbi:transcription factor bHLH30 [Cannabis sativa]|uniref:Uncharacterized protein n=1 Tax=Cannabis sativa TaxID=3483 RepID=A0A7J6GUB0_CANSA|nr:transcription factor bHLH30 [Cannabis sativa]KAF4354337.1 hypothetical protein F8388_022999 [Cannabis sativa]KAF4386544.1 hypothetical protein G4B88_006800 [Cannabis sativa]
MEPFSWSSGVSNSDFEIRNDGYLGNSSIRCGLVLDSLKGELVEAPAKLERKGVSAERTIEALKNHSEAEKRRRARINSHFDTLRNLTPGAKKMDKASLLAEVISHLKDLKRKTAETSEDCAIPKDFDEVKVEPEDEMEGRPYSIRVSLSCDYKPGLLSDLRQALDALQLIIMRAEIATLGCRMKNVFVITACNEDKVHARSIYQALRSVLDKFAVSEQFIGATLSNKKRRASVFIP